MDSQFPTDPFFEENLDSTALAASVGGGEAAPPEKRKKKSKAPVSYKKAPHAPKRFKSPYIHFSMSRIDDYRQKLGGNVKITTISKAIGEEWKKLPTEERKKWQDIAQKDKVRFEAEKQLYTGPWKIPSKRTKKDPRAPKRPCSAFLFFSQSERHKIKEQNPELQNTQISSLLGKVWKSLSEEERRPHVEREQREREQYHKDMAVWKKEREKEEEEMRERRQQVTNQYIQSSGMLEGVTAQAMPYPAMVPTAASGYADLSAGSQVMPNATDPSLAIYQATPPITCSPQLSPGASGSYAAAAILPAATDFHGQHFSFQSNHQDPNGI